MAWLRFSSCGSKVHIIVKFRTGRGYAIQNDRKVFALDNGGVKIEAGFYVTTKRHSLTGGVFFV